MSRRIRWHSIHEARQASGHIHVAGLRGVASQIDGGLNAAVNAKSKDVSGGIQFMKQGRQVVTYTLPACVVLQARSMVDCHRVFQPGTISHGAIGST
ncbi:hypothetical protein [Mycobacterium tuberculosis]|uniref:hypothetical protein n=1 Tax=Mycobacterium tuberculosis TaxID=1773 RepID=UPI00272A97A5|nr:hypothetical protein [Mycobacterium tuberculosis]